MAFYSTSETFEAVCPDCQKPCRVVTEDHGGTEEFWGAKVWMPYLIDFSYCCHQELSEEDYKEYNGALKKMTKWIQKEYPEVLEEYLEEKGE